MSSRENPRCRRTLFWLGVLVAGQMALGGCTAFRSGQGTAAFEPEVLIGEKVSQVPMYSDGNLQWRVRASVNGTVGLFALDTGSEATILSREFAEKLVLLPDALPGKFVGRNRVGQEVRYARIQDIALGGLAYLDFYAPILNLDHINRSMRTKIDGILGNNILSKTVCTFDWRKNRLTFEAGNTVRPPNAIPVKQADLRLYLAARINGRPARLELDTGSYATCLNPSEIRRLRIPPSRKIEVEAPDIDISDAGRRRKTKVLLDLLQVGGIERSNLAAMSWDYNVLGMDVLQNWILTVDARDGWLALKDFPE